MDWSREPISDFFKQVVFRSWEGWIWLGMSALYIVAAAGIWLWSGQLNKATFLLAWPFLLFMFYLLIAAPLSRSRLRVLGCIALVVAGTYPFFRMLE